MKIILAKDEEAINFLNKLKEGSNELVVPLEKWNTYIKDSSRIKPEDMPEHMICGDYVITERRWFEDIVHDLSYLFYKSKRLTQSEGGFWFSEKLEPKKKMPKHDIFVVGQRQPGSFRSKK